MSALEVAVYAVEAVEAVVGLANLLAAHAPQRLPGSRPPQSRGDVMVVREQSPQKKSHPGI
jgi:hypothetical protein